MSRDFIRERAQQMALEMSNKSDDLVDQIKPILAGQGPMVHGVVIAELLAIFIAGHRPDQRAEMLQVITDTAINFIPLFDRWKDKKKGDR